MARQKAIALPLGLLCALFLLIGSGFWPLLPPAEAEKKTELIEAPDLITAPLELHAAAPPISSSPETLSQPEPVAQPSIVAVDLAPAEAAAPESAKNAAPATMTVVQPGDNLWRISRRFFGKGGSYSQLYRSNPSLERDPQKIYPGQVILVPKDHD
ncbi:MAG: LysM peptidoglycan-binding domain-containing protein [Methylocella sp.]